MLNVSKTTRITTTIPTSLFNELKAMAEAKKISSVNQGIKLALDEYLKQEKKRQYDELMKEAAKDKSFIDRTINCAEDFSITDCEVQGEW